jgi:methylenetetrahydrofolate reductase (NADPH)
MKLNNIFKPGRTAISFEFFPPKTTTAADRLFEQAKALAELEPAYVSVTYGAGGSTRERTRQIVLRLRQELGLNAMPHLTCVGSGHDELVEIVNDFKNSGIDNIMALRGDPPRGEVEFVPHADGLSHANELVELIRSVGDFGIGVAGYPEGHPETISRIADLENLKRKVDAGADCVITQLFFDNRDFYDFRERCALVGIDVPIVAGIMPILSRRGIERMAGLCGTRIPARLMKRLMRYGDDDAAVARIGAEWAGEQCRDLIDHNTAGIHFYTLNRSTAELEIYRQLHKSGRL